MLGNFNGPPKKSVSAPPSVEKVAPVESVEKKSPRLLQGSFYLTKIAHTLEPQYIPDIEEPAEGKQTFTREGVVYETPESDGDDVEKSGETAETGSEIAAISDKLEQLGLTRRVDAHYRSYVGEGKGNVRYVKTLAPWEVVESAPGTLELLFDIKSLRSNIRRRKSLSPDTKKICEGYLGSIIELFEQEKLEQERIRKENLRDCAEGVKEVEGMLAMYESPAVSETLFAITTEEQAVHSELRKKAAKDCSEIDKKLKILKTETTITEEQYDNLRAQYKKLQQAVGMRNGGMVDHTR